MNNIRSVIDNQVCTGCGACSNICPSKCIKTLLNPKSGYYETELTDSNCIDCGACRKVCPVYTWNNNDNNVFVGSYLVAYSGYNTDETLRKECASGGITTALLVYLLRKGVIDAAVVSTRPKDNPLESKLKIVYTEEEVIASKGSVYSPTSYVDIVDEIIKSEKTKFAIVGLPCHIEGITSLCKIRSKIAQKIKFKIALVCGHTPSITAYHYSLRHLHVDINDVNTLSNRGDGWPGYMKLNTKSNHEIKIPYSHKYSWGLCLSSCVFTPPGCRHCPDATGYNADVSICDAWLKKYKDDTIGRNLLLIRNLEMLSIIQRMKDEHIVEIQEETIVDFVKANDRVFAEKLVINRYKNESVNEKGLFANVNYIKLTSVLPNLMSRLYVISENAYHKCLGQKHANSLILFYFKVLKYLALKWVRIY